MHVAFLGDQTDGGSLMWPTAWLGAFGNRVDAKSAVESALGAGEEPQVGLVRAATLERDGALRFDAGAGDPCEMARGDRALFEYEREEGWQVLDPDEVALVREPLAGGRAPGPPARRVHVAAVVRAGGIETLLGCFDSRREARCALETSATEGPDSRGVALVRALCLDARGTALAGAADGDARVLVDLGATDLLADCARDLLSRAALGRPPVWRRGPDARLRAGAESGAE